MELSKIDPAKTDFSGEELDALAEILVKAKQINDDHTLSRLVMNHVDKKVEKFKSIDDLKKHSKNIAAEQDASKEAK